MSALISADRIYAHALKMGIKPGAISLEDPLFSSLPTEWITGELASHILAAFQSAGLTPSDALDCNRITKIASAVCDLHVMKNPDAEGPGGLGFFGFWYDRFGSGHMLCVNVRWQGGIGPDIEFIFHEPNPSMPPGRCMGIVDLTPKEIASCLDFGLR